MAGKLHNVFNNSLEDGLDDFISSVLFNFTRTMSQPFKDKFQADPDQEPEDKPILQDEFHGAMQNFITTLTMGLTIQAYLVSMQLVQKYILQNTTLWVYIVSGKLKNKLKNLANKKLKGKKAKIVLNTVLDSDKTSERIQVAQIINDNFNHIDKKMQDEKYLRVKLEDRLINMGYSSATLKGVSNDAKFNLFFYKTKTGTWKADNTDKELFESVIGQDIQTAFGKGWNSLYIEFNRYTEFAKNSEDEIFNLTQALLKTVNRSQVLK